MCCIIAAPVIALSHMPVVIDSMEGNTHGWEDKKHQKLNIKTCQIKTVGIGKDYPVLKNVDQLQ